LAPENVLSAVQFLDKDRTDTEINWPNLTILKVRGPVPYVPESHPQARTSIFLLIE